METPCKLSCTGTSSGRSKVVMACVQANCQYPPFICGEESCQCRTLHTSHRIIFLEGVFEKVNRGPNVDPLILAAHKSMSIIIDNTIASLQVLRHIHQEQLGYIASQYKYRQARTKLLSQDNNYLFTGDVLFHMMEELENGKQVQSPYLISKVEIETRLASEVARQTQHLVETIKHVWKLSTSTTKKDSEQPEMKTAIDYFNRGVEHYNKGNNEQALHDWNTAIQIDPNNSFAYNGRGLLYSNTGQQEKALHDYNQAIVLNPTNSNSYNCRGNLFYNMGQHQKALHDYNQAILLDSKFASAYFNRGNLYYTTGQREKAVQDYNETIRLNPKDANAYNGRGNVFFNMGLKEKALQDYNQAVQFDPKNGTFIKNRAIALEQLNRK